MADGFDLVVRGGLIVDGSGDDSYVGDVAVRDGWIVEVGDVQGAGTREIDACGLLVTPGFVDLHTHYDGQLIWSETMSPSSSHGVTTVMTGNCGIGFAPCRAGDRAALISLMEGVEDIPEAVTAAGLTWDWETFPEYLDAVDRRQRDVDVVAMLPHSPLRVYVMGERAINREPATPEDIAAMKSIAAEALAAGAVGMGTSLMGSHRTSSGDQIPTYGVDEQELLALGDAMHEADSGIFQLIATMRPDAFDADLDFMSRFAARSGRTVTYTQALISPDPSYVPGVLGRLQEVNAEPGVQVKAQLYPRPIGLIVGLTVSMNPFSEMPSWDAMRALSLSEQVAEMRKPEVRERLLTETPQDPKNPLFHQTRRFASMFVLDPKAPNYEPDREESIAARAAVAGVEPIELLYDLLLEDDGERLLLVAMSNYADYTLDVMEGMLRDPNVVIGLGDGGAHYGMICDASYPTFALTHWARDRDHGRLSVEETVHFLTRKPAEVIGLHDRGLIAPGYRANINLIDHRRLTLMSPEVRHDLPGGGKRLHQRAEGYVATFVNGVAIAENDEPTGACPGRLLRGSQPQASLV
jgi:N-acyl-D-amino-acid deacylase